MTALAAKLDEAMKVMRENTDGDGWGREEPPIRAAIIAFAREAVREAQCGCGSACCDRCRTITELGALK